jgi:hypothetical protein
MLRKHEQETPFTPRHTVAAFANAHDGRAGSGMQAGNSVKEQIFNA